jgi:hypothetical protein
MYKLLENKKINVKYKCSDKCDFSHCYLYNKQRHYHTDDKIVCLDCDTDFCQICNKEYKIIEANNKGYTFTHTNFCDFIKIGMDRKEYFLTYHGENCHSEKYLSLFCAYLYIYRDEYIYIFTNELKKCKKCSFIYILDSGVFDNSNELNNRYHFFQNKHDISKNKYYIYNQSHCDNCCTTYEKAC